MKLTGRSKSNSRRLEQGNRGGEQVSCSLRVEEQYFQFNDELVFLSGLDRAKIPEKSSVKRLLVLSTEAVRHGISTLDSLPSLGKGTLVLAVQSSLHVVLDEAKKPLRQKIKSYFLESPDAAGSRYVLLNELSESLYSARAERERAESYCNRLVVGVAMQMLHGVGHNVTVLCLNDADSQIGVCGELGVPAKTIVDFFSSDKWTELGLDSSEVDTFQMSLEGALTSFEEQSRGGALASSRVTDSQLFAPHLSPKELRRGIATGNLFEGTIEMKRGSKRKSKNGKHAAVKEAVATLDAASRRRLALQGTKTDILIIRGEKDLNRCVNGDVVVLETLRGGERERAQGQGQEDENESDDDDWLPSPTLFGVPARVRGVLRRAPVTKGVLCLFPDSKDSVDSSLSTKAVLMRPADSSLPAIRVRTRHSQRLAGCTVLVHVDDWPASSKYPEGHVTRSFGRGGCYGWRHAVQVLLAKHHILSTKGFSTAAMACLPALPASKHKGGGAADIYAWQVPRSMEGDCSRQDLRGARMVLSIDPRGCQDIDDALHVHFDKAKPAGTLELGVHIADVTCFLAEGCALDREAMGRGSTVYMPHDRFDMLPSVLSANVCSLHSGVDRCAVSVVWGIRATHRDGCTPVGEHEDPLLLDEQGDLLLSFHCADEQEQEQRQRQEQGQEQGDGGSRVSHVGGVLRMGRSLIRSAAALTYSQAQHLADTGHPGSDQPDCGPGKHWSPGMAGGALDPALHRPCAHAVRWLMAISRWRRRARLGESGAGGGEDSGDGGGGAKAEPKATSRGLDMEMTTAQTQLSFALGADGRPQAITPEEHSEVHSTVAELMILANGAVAHLLSTVASTVPPSAGTAARQRAAGLTQAALIRVHPPPSSAKLRELEEYLQHAGVTPSEQAQTQQAQTQQAQGAGTGTGTGTGASTPAEMMERLRSLRSLISATDPATGKRRLGDEEADLLMSVAIRSMNEALYSTPGALAGSGVSSSSSSSSSGGSGDGGGDGGGGDGGGGEGALDFFHVGLGLKYYTHFTSPIRRYADVVVHRQLLAALALLEGGDNGGGSAEGQGQGQGQAPLTVEGAETETESYEQSKGAEDQGEGEKDDDEEDEDEDDFLDALLDGVGEGLLGPDSESDSESDQQSQTQTQAQTEEGLAAGSSSSSTRAKVPATAPASAATSSSSVPPSQQAHSVTALCSSLNQVTQRCRLLQRDLQDVFLLLYFNPWWGAKESGGGRWRAEKHLAVVSVAPSEEYPARVFVPALDLRGKLSSRAQDGVDRDRDGGGGREAEAEAALVPLQRVWVEVRGQEPAEAEGEGEGDGEGANRGEPAVLIHFLSLEGAPPPPLSRPASASASASASATAKADPLMTGGRAKGAGTSTSRPGQKAGGGGTSDSDNTGLLAIPRHLRDIANIANIARNRNFARTFSSASTSASARRKDKAQGQGRSGAGGRAGGGVSVSSAAGRRYFGPRASSGSASGENTPPLPLPLPAWALAQHSRGESSGLASKSTPVAASASAASSGTSGGGGAAGGVAGEARERMAAMGEAWGADEALPGYVRESSSTEVTGKDLRAITARVDKLKTAKRKY